MWHITSHHDYLPLLKVVVAQLKMYHYDLLARTRCRQLANNSLPLLQVRHNVSIQALTLTALNIYFILFANMHPLAQYAV